VDAIDPEVHVVPVGEAAFLEGAVLGLPLVGQARDIRGETAEEMEMVAIERVFVISISKALARTARELYRVSEDLSGLHRMVERAHLLKEIPGSNPRSRPST
jgi:hypothetical protein